MKVEKRLIPEMTIEEFAEKHDLIMEVNERRSDRMRRPWRFYASFKYAELREGDRLLRGAYGNGDTAEEAIANYAEEISGGLLILNAYGSDRKEIKVPRLLTHGSSKATRGYGFDSPPTRRQEELLSCPCCCRNSGGCSCDNAEIEELLDELEYANEAFGGALTRREWDTIMRAARRLREARGGTA